MTKKEFYNWECGNHKPVKAIELFDGTIYKIGMGKFPIKYCIITKFNRGVVYIDMYKRKFDYKRYKSCITFDPEMDTYDLIQNNAFRFLSLITIKIKFESIKKLWK